MCMMYVHVYQTEMAFTQYVFEEYNGTKKLNCKGLEMRT